MGLLVPAITCASKSMLNGSHNTFNVLANIFIRKMQRSYASLNQLGIAGTVPFVLMSPSIDLYSQAFTGTEEIDDKWHDHMLTSKLVARKL